MDAIIRKNNRDMKREIKFRGMNAQSEWVYGFYMANFSPYNNENEIVDSFIYRGLRNIESAIPVNGESVGEFTGLFDKNSVEIYEGDIVQTNHISKGVIAWSPMASQWWINFTDEVSWRKSYKELIPDYGDDNLYCQYIEIIGNIYQNPDLLK